LTRRPALGAHFKSGSADVAANALPRGGQGGENESHLSSQTPFASAEFVMLKGVPPVISPDLMHLLMKMGHGDEIVIADGNFPSDSKAQQIVRADGLGVVEVLEAILKFLPIDKFVDDPVAVMKPVNAKDPEPPIWKDFRRLLELSEARRIELTQVERFEFYEKAEAAYCVVATSDSALYANIILKKGVVVPKA
jgi:L-fucose mutarotase